MLRNTIRSLLIFAFMVPFTAGTGAEYSWLKSDTAREALTERIQPPSGYRRVITDDPYAAWLRGLPLKPGRPFVYLHDGRRKSNQSAHFAVIDMDVGPKDLQQCADAIMRLRAEYQFSKGDWRNIRFNFTDGVPARYALWRSGHRPRVRNGRKTAWLKRAKPDGSYAAFRKYMDVVFTYAGTYSLSREMKRVRPDQMRIGDVFIQGGFPGHAVIVVDMAEHIATGKRIFLLAQSFMPAQEMHVLVNPNGNGPWYSLPVGDKLVTPEWDFKKGDLKRF